MFDSVNVAFLFELSNRIKLISLDFFPGFPRDFLTDLADEKLDEKRVKMIWHIL